jgi:glycosyltransferase involved in cell wall biosynthesis
VFVYLGNVGIAQSLDIIIELATNLRDRDDIGFLFVGRGTEFARLSEMARSRALPNVLFHGEIEPWEVPGLLEQCHVGLLSLDPRHKTHNVPGKFLSYLHAGLPVIARVNPGIDLAGLIEKERIGVAYVGDSVAELQRIVLQFADDGSLREEAASRCKEIGSRLFLPEAAARQIVASVSRSSSSTLVQPTRGDGGREGVP